MLGDCRQCEVFHWQILNVFFLSVTLFCGPATMSYLYHLLKWLWCLQSFVKCHTFVELSFIEYKTLPNMLSQQTAYVKKKKGKKG